MAFGSDQEKTERATPKKREEARKKGQVAKSREVVTTVVFVGALLTLYFYSPRFLDQLLNMMRGFLSQATTLQVTPANFNLLSQQVLHQLLLLTAPILIATMVTALLGNVMQVGFLLTGEPLTPKLDKLDPLKGLGKMVSKQSLMELAKSMAKILIVGYIAYLVVRKEFFVSLPTLGDQEVGGILFYVSRVSFTILIRVLGFMVILSILDYAFQRWQYEEQLKMTKQEVKDEYKQREGDPQIKARVKRVQRELARKRMLADVPHADVIITNPTHLAVALKYDSNRGPAPVVVAKGADFLAEKIRGIARSHGVPLVEDKPLARALYKTVKLGAPIPENLFRAVAEILAYVYSLKGRR
ncbi:MAG: flagellar biosynthesis protein FlhB [bacterium]|nr:flagellar biosynthesis protein FlhB [bacterium]